MTGDDDPAKRERCLEAGCVDVLIKPVPVRELMAVTERWMAR
jgi:CheY-like chemotaxis protein